jgi:hypothetical protein
LTTSTIEASGGDDWGPVVGSRMAVRLGGGWGQKAKPKERRKEEEEEEGGRGARGIDERC